MNFINRALVFDEAAAGKPKLVSNLLQRININLHMLYLGPFRKTYFTGCVAVIHGKIYFDRGSLRILLQQVKTNGIEIIYSCNRIVNSHQRFH